MKIGFASIGFGLFFALTISLGSTEASPVKKLSLKASEIFDQFNQLFTAKVLANSLPSDEASKEQVKKELKEMGMFDKMKSAFGYGTGGKELLDPQGHFSQLAFLYTVLNRSDLDSAIAINRMCTLEGYLDLKLNPNLCQTYPIYLLNQIEMRMGVITSRILNSKDILGIPKGWLEHVQNIVKELEVTDLMTDSFKHLLLLLTDAAKNNPEIDQAFITNLLRPKSGATLNSSQHYDQQPSTYTAAAAPPTKIIIDARNLLKMAHDQSKCSS